MNAKTILWTILATLALLLSGCKSNDEPVIDPPEEEGEPTMMTLHLSDPNAKTKGASGVQGALDEESLKNITHVKVFVFTSKGKFYNAALVPISAGTDSETGKWITGPFEALAGNGCKIYVFSDVNDCIEYELTETTLAADKTALTGKTTSEFEKVAFPTYGAAATNKPFPDKIATDNQFLIGTLYGEKINIEAGGTSDLPVKVPLTIGRAVSKVRLTNVELEPKEGSSLKDVGSFILDDVNPNEALRSPMYVIKSVPTQMYQVGIPLTTALPHAAGAAIMSAVHEIKGSDGTTDGDGKFIQSPEFENYTFAASQEKKPNNGNVLATSPREVFPTDYFYIVENSYNRSTVPAQYGNTTYMQVRIKFQPNSGVIHDATGNNDGSNLLTDGTFFVGYDIAGNWKIFNANPDAALLLDKVVKYQNGIMYYSFPLIDPREDVSGASIYDTRHQIIRNHSYEYAVSNILGFGENEEYVDPTKPITTPTIVDLVITVAQWSLVVENDIVLD